MHIVLCLFIVCYHMLTRMDYSSILEYSIIRLYTNIAYYYYVLGAVVICYGSV